MAIAVNKEYIQRALESIDRSDDFLRELINMGIEFPEGINPREIYGDKLFELIDSQIAQKNLVQIPSPMHRVYLQVAALRDHEWFLREKEAWYAAEQNRWPVEITAQIVIDSWNSNYANKFNNKYFDDYLNNRRFSQNVIRQFTPFARGLGRLEELLKLAVQ